MIDIGTMLLNSSFLSSSERSSAQIGSDYGFRLHGCPPARKFPLAIASRMIMK